MRELRPIIDKKQYTNELQKVIFHFLYVSFLKPIEDVIKPIEEFYNDNGIIIDAIRKNQIQYVEGKFYGKFDAKISKALIDLGAKWNKRTKTFDILREKLPMDIVGAIGAASVYTMTLQKALLDVLSTLNVEQAMPETKKILDVALDMILDDLDAQAIATLQKAMTIVPQLSDYQKSVIKNEYIEDVQLSISNFTTKEINKLRNLVQQNAFYGLKNTSLVQLIQKEFNTTLNKARFLARNETGIFVAKYRKSKYEQVGITKYRWSTSHDERVREDHKLLGDNIFSFSDPPIADRKSGLRGNPGEVWQCRCVAIPIID